CSAPSRRRDRATAGEPGDAMQGYEGGDPVHGAAGRCDRRSGGGRFPAGFRGGARERRTRFFFQAEDGIRDYKVTGVQTCALPISSAYRKAPSTSPSTGTRPTPITTSGRSPTTMRTIF